MGMSYPTARDEQAAYWYLKLQEPHVGAEDIQAALAWQADPDNRAAFDRVQNFWRAWPDEVAISSGTESSKRARPHLFWQAAAALVAFVSLGVWAVLSLQGPLSEPSTRQYAASIGQIRTVWLEDGTEVILGGATSIRTIFDDDVRRVVMSDGEALFSVAEEPERPFIVDVSNGSARVLGTTFNVHRGPDGATITVLDGIVQVDPPSWRPGASAVLNAGKQVAASLDGEIGEIREVDPLQVASWQSGTLVFADRTLRSIVADLNRYSAEPVTLASTEVADLRVSGNIKLDHIETWLQALGPAFGIDLLHDEHGMVLVSRIESRGR